MYNVPFAFIEDCVLNVILSMVNGLLDYVMSIIIKINKFINSIISINLTEIYTNKFSIIVFKFHIFTKWLTFYCVFLKFFITEKGQ